MNTLSAPPAPRRTPTDAVLDEVADERRHNATIWTNEADDECNFPVDWVGLIASTALRQPSLGPAADFGIGAIANFRRSMLKVAALAVAAVEWCDRRTGIGRAGR